MYYRGKICGKRFYSGGKGVDKEINPTRLAIGNRAYGFLISQVLYVYTLYGLVISKRGSKRGAVSLITTIIVVTMYLPRLV